MGNRENDNDSWTHKEMNAEYKKQMKDPYYTASVYWKMRSHTVLPSREKQVWTPEEISANQLGNAVQDQTLWKL